MDSTQITYKIYMNENSTIAALRAASFSLSQDDIDILLQEESENVKQQSNEGRRSSRRKLPAVSHSGNVQTLEFQNAKSGYLKQIETLNVQLEDQIKANSLLQVKLEASQRSRPGPAHNRQSVTVPEVEILKNNLYNILPTDLQYVQIQSIPEDKRSILDLVRSRVYEELSNLQKECRDLRQKRDLYAAKDRELESLRYRTKSNDQELKDKNDVIAGLEGKLMMARSDIEIEQRKLEEYRERNSLIESTLDRVNGLTEKVALCEVRLKEAEDEKRHLLTSQYELQRDREDMLRQVDILKLDKVYLTKETQVLSDRCAQLEEKLALRSQELERAKEDQLMHFQNVLAQSERNRTDYETRLQQELSNIRSRTSVDLEDIKRNTRDVYEREIQSLKDNLHLMREDCKTMTISLENMQKQNSELQQILVMERNKNGSEITTLQQQVKSKTFETERMRILYEDTVASLKQSQLEVDKHVKKVDLLTKELAYVQHDSSIQISDLELLANARLQKLELLGGDDVTVASDGISRRKLKRDIAIDTDLHDMRISMEQMRTTNEKLTAEVRLLEDLLSKSGEPVQAFVNSLRDKEHQLSEMGNQSSQTMIEISDLRAECDKLKAERNSLMVDMRKLSENRQNMIQIRKLITEILSEKHPLNMLDIKFLQRNK